MQIKKDIFKEMNQSYNFIPKANKVNSQLL